MNFQHRCEVLWSCSQLLLTIDARIFEFGKLWLICSSFLDFSLTQLMFFLGGGAEEMLALYKEDRLLMTTPAISAKGLGWLVLLTCKFIYL